MNERRSPQGWLDDEPGWPRSAGPAALGFPSPWDAVEALEVVYAAIADIDGRPISAGAAGSAAESLGNELRRRLDDYARCLHALYVLDADMAPRKGTYGRLARAAERHLVRTPRLILAPTIALRLDYLAEDLVDSGDRDLALEGVALEGTLTQARRAVAESSQPT